MPTFTVSHEVNENDFEDIQECLFCFIGREWDGEPQTYYCSEQWQRMRQLVFLVHGRACEHCGSMQQLHIHHVLGLHKSFDVVHDFKVLCFECHDQHHYYKLSGEAM